MDGIIKVDFEPDRPTVSARELHEFLEVKTDFRHWFDRMTEYGFTENVDFTRLVQKCPTLGGTQDTVDYQMTIDMAKEICMIQRSAKGKLIRQYFIQLEKDWNSPENVMARALKIADKQMAQLKESNARLELKAAQDAPKVQFADALNCSNDCILIGEFAKILQQSGVSIGQNRLFAWLRKQGYLMRNGNGDNVPTQRSMNMGLFRIKNTTIPTGSGICHIVTTPLVTGKGQRFFTNKFLNQENYKKE